MKNSDIQPLSQTQDPSRLEMRIITHLVTSLQRKGISSGMVIVLYDAIQKNGHIHYYINNDYKDYHCVLVSTKKIQEYNEWINRLWAASREKAKKSLKRY